MSERRLPAKYRREHWTSDWAYAGRMQALIDADMDNDMPDDVRTWVEAHTAQAESVTTSDPRPAPGYLDTFHTPTLDEPEEEPWEEGLGEPDGPLSTVLGKLRDQMAETDYDEDGVRLPRDDEDGEDESSQPSWPETIRILDGSETIKPVDPTGRYSRGRKLEPKDRHPVFRALRHIPPQTVFVPNRDPNSLSNLYKQGRSKRRRIRVILTAAEVDRVMGTIVQNGGPLPESDG